MDSPANETEIGRRFDLATLSRHHVSSTTTRLVFHGDGDHGPGWTTLVALDARPLSRWSRGGTATVDNVLGELDRRVLERRARGGGPGTGVAALLGFDLFNVPRTRSDHGIPDFMAVEVEASVRLDASRGAVFARTRRSTQEIDPDRWTGDPGVPATTGSSGALRAIEQPTTSLPRDAYLQAVETVQDHIRRGDIYQANLTQRFTVDAEGDPFSMYERLRASTPAPRSAFWEMGGVCVASVSPETFLRIDSDGVIETYPIKGTRPRDEDPERDDALARELWTSEKDRAELTMIVDLERNDLGRICRVGSVEVPRIAALQSFPAVHHLVGHVRGRLRHDTGPAEWIRATFPGGSITGAPKLRALEILRDLEPLPRNFFTGSLLWFGDDGTLESSILIRSVVVSGGRAYLGAGGGVVADSDPEQEWQEANHKARPLARVLGFDPEDAT